MAHLVRDRVKETSTTTGTGSFTLSGAVTGYDSWSGAGFANNDTGYYCIEHQSANEWEVGLGTWTTGGVLVRTTVLDGSNGTSAVNFSSGTKHVFNCDPASAQVTVPDLTVLAGGSVDTVNDELPIWDASASELKAVPAWGLGKPITALKSSDQTAIGTSYADISGTGLAVGANADYYFEFFLYMDSDATTTGIDVAVNGPASPTQISYVTMYWTSATAVAFRNYTAYDGNPGSTASNGATARPYWIRGILRNGANAGTLIARAKREAVGSGPNARSGSYGMAWRLA